MIWYLFVFFLISLLKNYITDFNEILHEDDMNTWKAYFRLNGLFPFKYISRLQDSGLFIYDRTKNNYALGNFILMTSKRSPFSIHYDH